MRTSHYDGRFLPVHKIYEQLPMRCVSVLPDEGVSEMMLEVTGLGRRMLVRVMDVESARAIRRMTRAGLVYRTLIKCDICGEWHAYAKIGQHYGSKRCVARQQRQVACERVF